MSTPMRLLRILFESLKSLERLDEREAFLDHTCQGDPELRTRLERMLSVQEEADDFFDIETAPAHESSGIDQVDDENVTEGVGARIGRYRLLERLGEGGCGVVYLAEQQEPVKRRVALKIIRLGMDTESVIARFEMERQSLAMMDHPNIARVYDVGATRTGRPFFVMQLVDGEKITDYCNAKRLGTPQRLKLFIRICQAIQHAHQKGVIHRDIKPSNIIVWENDGEAVPKVIDFGIAKATAGSLDENATFTSIGQFVGTPAYMSPEQASGNVDVDTRSDIFSLGSLLYELLTGRPPFDASELQKAGADEIRRILQEVEPREPSAVVSSLKPDELREIAAQHGCDPQKLAGLLRGDLDRIVMKALEKDRKRRYGTADSFAADVNRYLNYEPVSARPSGRFYRLTKLVRRNKVVFAASALVVFFLVMGLGASTWMFLRENQARAAAERARATEVMLREKAEMVVKIAQAAVQLKYGHYEKADELLEKIPPAEAQPSLESAATFRTLGTWHAREGRWREAANRYAALAYSITSVDESDTDAVSIDLLPAAAAMCEAKDYSGYESLRAMAISRFRGTNNPVVAEQVVKACLILPADTRVMKQLEPLVMTMSAAEAKGGARTPQERNLAAWRKFSLCLVEYRRGNFQAALGWVGECIKLQNGDTARDALARTVAAMAWHRLGREEDARKELATTRSIIGAKFSRKSGIFEASGSSWRDWEYSRILLREADASIGR
ncbi:MAG: serine/threonine-protein kinase [Luteolibacter sp.]